MPWVASVQTGIFVALGVLAFRAFPVLAAFVVGPARSTAQKLGAVALYTLAAYFAVEYSDFRSHHLLVAYLYLGAASLAAYLLPRRIPQFLSLTLLCVLFLVLPGGFVDGEPPLVVLGGSSCCAFTATAGRCLVLRGRCAITRSSCSSTRR